MPNQNCHIILRQVLELEFPAGEDGFALQQEISRIVREILLPALETLFDKFAPAGEVVRVDELKIDLGNLPLHNLEEALVKGVLEEMERQLFYPTTPTVRQMQRQPVAGSRFEQWLFFLEKGWLPWQASGVGEAELHLAALEKMASDSGAVEQFVRLLRQRPAVPDRLATQHPESFLAHLLETLTARNQSKLPALRQELETLLPKVLQSFFRKKQPVFSAGAFRQTFWKTLMRLATGQQMPSRTTEVLALHFLQEWFAGQSGGQQKSIAPAWGEFFKTVHRQAKSFPLLRQMSTLPEWQVFEKTASASAPEVEFESRQVAEIEQVDLTEPALKPNAGRVPNPSDVFDESVIEPNVGRVPNPADVFDYSKFPLGGKVQENDVRQVKSSDEASLPLQPSPSILSKPNQAQESVLPQQIGEESLKPATQKEEPAAPFTPQEGDAWYVRNAGIVLLHPFFAPFFKEFHLLENDQFISEEARCRAVHLLQFLATGETGLPEYELVLPKFLCGMPFDTPLERDLPLTEPEKPEGENLLKAVIRHWSKLGNASPAGLREGFLQRDGKLELRQQGWFLCVEQKSTDILLDWLPWNLSLIRLPWLPDLLRVEWA